LGRIKIQAFALLFAIPRREGVCADGLFSIDVPFSSVVGKVGSRVTGALSFDRIEIDRFKDPFQFL
jgi:hypothetical protein